jgi:hypothetical protein
MGLSGGLVVVHAYVFFQSKRRSEQVKFLHRTSAERCYTRQPDVRMRSGDGAHSPPSDCQTLYIAAMTEADKLCFPRD